MPFAQFATDPEQAFQVWPEFKISEDQLKEFKTNRQACVCDRRIAEKRGWKIGQRVPLKGTFYPVNMDLELVGTFDSPKNTDSLWFNWKYLDESLRDIQSDAAGSSGTIFARILKTPEIPGVIKKIDDRFASSDTPTRSQTEAAFAQMFVDMLGDIQFVILAISFLVVICLSLIAANSMAMAMRERVTEIAVLKAIGFSRQRILVMVLGEAFVVSFLGRHSGRDHGMRSAASDAFGAATAVSVHNHRDAGAVDFLWLHHFWLHWNHQRNDSSVQCFAAVGDRRFATSGLILSVSSDGL